MTKKQIIDIINKAVPIIDKDLFDEKNDSKKIGCNQFRELAGICRHAECYEEIEMLIRYNEAKSKDKDKNKNKEKSWAMIMKDEKTTFAGIVVECMQKIKAASDGDEDCLNNLSLFFGYFYWNARIWTADRKAAPKSGEYNDKGRNFSGNNQKQYNNRDYRGGENRHNYNSQGRR